MARAAVTEHYFSAEPAAADVRRTLRVRLTGHELTVTTAAGTFSPDRLDAGTAVLLAAAPDPPPSGHLLDLGCGWGPVALSLALRAPAATVWAVDVNERSLDLTRANAAALGLGGVRAVRPEEVPDDVALAGIWSNPPVRVGKAALRALLQQWLPRLSPGAAAHLVVRKDLGAESLQRWLTDVVAPGLGAGVERVARDRGYWVLAVTR